MIKSILFSFVALVGMAVSPAFAQATDDSMSSETRERLERLEEKHDTDQVKTQNQEDATRMSDLKDERKSTKATAREAKRVERDARSAARESRSAYRTEKKAQKSRTDADKQAKKAVKAKEKSDGND